MEEKGKPNINKDSIFVRKIRAGKRMYFLDVKATYKNDLYLTITERKKVFEDEQSIIKKHKIFLYKEDFEKFTKALIECVDFVKEQTPEEIENREDSEYTRNNERREEGGYTRNNEKQEEPKKDEQGESDEYKWN